MNYSPRNIMVTGGAGFIGCNFVRYMLKNDSGVRIVNLDALTYAGSLENLRDFPDESRHVFVRGDICDRERVDGLLREYHIDCIVHFAAESHVDNSISGPEIFIKTNVMGTYTLLESARAYWLDEQGWSQPQCRFHHVSTDEVYGTLAKQDAAFTERTPYAPNSPYSASKAASDHLARAWFHTYNLPVTTSNCSNNYGAYQHDEKLIPTIIRHCVAQSSIPVYGNGGNIRDWLYVEDHCSGIDAVLRRGKPGEVYNIGGCNEWENLAVVKRVCTLMDEYFPQHAPHTNLISFVTDRAGHDWRYAIDASKIFTALDWQPCETFETGIRKTVAWYLSKMGVLLNAGKQEFL